MNLRLAGLLIAQFLLVSCAVPLPHRRVHSYGVSGRVVDSKTSQPIAGAEIVLDSPAEKKRVVSGRNGEFVVRPVYGWHGVYVISPVSMSLLPGFDLPYPGRPIRISAVGYEPIRITQTDFLFPDDGRYIDVGVQRLVPLGVKPPPKNDQANPQDSR